MTTQGPAEAAGAAGIDEVAAWHDAHERVCSVIEDLDEAQVEQTVPACPDWTVRELLAHMVGLGADVLAGDEPDDHHATWTQRQVDERAERSARALVAEWRGLAPDLEAWMREHGARPLGDVVIHEQDLRGAVGRPGGRDTRAMGLVTRRMLGRLATSLEGRPAVALVGGSGTWVSDGSDLQDAAVVLEASDFDIARAVTSRRSPGQLRSWVVRGELEPVLDAFAVLGPLPQRELPE